MRESERLFHLGRWAASPKGAPGGWHPFPHPRSCCQTEERKTRESGTEKAGAMPGAHRPGDSRATPSHQRPQQRYRDILFQATEELRRLLGHFIQASIQGAVCKERGVGGAARRRPQPPPRPSLAPRGQTHRPPTRKATQPVLFGPSSPDPGTTRRCRGGRGLPAPEPPASTTSPWPPSCKGRAPSLPAFPVGLPLPPREPQGPSVPQPRSRPEACRRTPQSSGLSRLSVKKRVGSAISLRSISSAIFPPAPQP